MLASAPRSDGSSSVRNHDIQPPPLARLWASERPPPSHSPSVVSAHVTQPAIEASSSSSVAFLVSATTALMIAACTNVIAVVTGPTVCIPNATDGPGCRELRAPISRPIA